MRRLFIACSFLLCLFPLTAHAQSANPAAAADTTTLQQQFDRMVRRSRRSYETRLVRESWLEAFMVNVADTLREKATRINELNETINIQTQKLQENSSALLSREVEIGDLEQESQQIGLFGMTVRKTTYSIVLYSLIGLLLLFSVFALTRMRLAIASARNANAKSAKLTEELEVGRRRRLEIERTLKRQLQDEINKRNAQS